LPPRDPPLPESAGQGGYSLTLSANKLALHQVLFALIRLTIAFSGVFRISERTFFLPYPFERALRGAGLTLWPFFSREVFIGSSWAFSFFLFLSIRGFLAENGFEGRRCPFRLIAFLEDSARSRGELFEPWGHAHGWLRRTFPPPNRRL